MKAYIAELALNHKPPLAQRCKMSAARYKAHIAAPLGESRPEVASNTARSHDCDPVLLRLSQYLPGQLKSKRARQEDLSTSRRIAF
jgi:hypothetical protein